MVLRFISGPGAQNHKQRQKMSRGCGKHSWGVRLFSRRSFAICNRISSVNIRSNRAVVKSNRSSASFFVSVPWCAPSFPSSRMGGGVSAGYRLLRRKWKFSCPFLQMKSPIILVLFGSRS